MITKTDIELQIVDSVDTSNIEGVLADSASNPDAFYVGRGYLAKGGEKVIESIDEKGTYPNVTVGNATKATTADTATRANTAATAATAVNISDAPVLTATEDEQITIKVGNKTSNALTVPYAQRADFATDLSGRVEATPEVFTYRPSAGDKSIKDDNAFIRSIKGNSVVWNQIAKEINSANWGVYNSNNASISFNSNIATVTVTNYASDIYGYSIGARLTSAVPTVPNHKYLIAAEIKSDIAMLFGLELNSKYTEIGFVTNEWTYCANIETSNRTVTTLIISPRYPFTAELNTYSFRNLICIDLTAMFGAGNEPTAEEFRALYPNSYYPYNAGELRNLSCFGIRTVGFNQWDEVWELGYINTIDGLNYDSTTCIRSAGYIRCFPNTEYYISDAGATRVFAFYDADKKFIGYTERDNLCLTPTNCVYIRFFVEYGTNVSTYNNDICINLHHTGYRDGEYERYKEVVHTLPLRQITGGQPLRKAGDVYDEIIETEYIRRVGVRSYTEGDKDDATLLTDGTYTNYPLDESIITPIETPIDFNYYVEDFGTEEAILAENSAPFSADIIYQFNATDQVRNNTRNIQRLQKSVFTPSGTTSQYIRGDGSYADVSELSRVIPINGGEGEGIDVDGGQNLEFRLFPHYYAKSVYRADADMYQEVIIRVEAPDNTDFVAEYWFELEIGESIPPIIRFENPDDETTSFRFNGEIQTYAVNIWHIITTDGGMRYFGEIKSYLIE